MEDAFVAGSQEICAQCRYRPLLFQSKTGQVKNCGMFWVTDSEMVTEDHPNRPSSITMGKWKEIKRSDGIFE